MPYGPYRYGLFRNPRGRRLPGGPLAYGAWQSGLAEAPPFAARDRDAFLGTTLGPGIVGLIQDAGLFDVVAYADRSDVAPITSAARTWAIVRPTGQATKKEPAPDRKVRLVQYAVEIQTDVPDGPEAEEQLGYIFAVLYNALHNAPFGGFCLFDWSQVERDTADVGANPGGKLLLMGQFAYVVAFNPTGLFSPTP